MILVYHHPQAGPHRSLSIPPILGDLYIVCIVGLALAMVFSWVVCSIGALGRWRWSWGVEMS